MALYDQMNAQSLATAKSQVYEVCSRGANIVLSRAATKDEMGTALTESTLSLKAFPVRFSPYDRQVTEKISWAEETDILCFVPKKKIDLLGLTTQQIQSRYKILRHENKTYDIRYIENYSPFFNDYLYVVVGGKA